VIDLKGRGLQAAASGFVPMPVAWNAKKIKSAADTLKFH
jgi:hypothetical protein